MKRKEGYYWCKGFTWSEEKSWAIYWWDGNYFWSGDEDFSEDCMIEIDENKIERIVN